MGAPTFVTCGLWCCGDREGLNSRFTIRIGGTPLVQSVMGFVVVVLSRVPVESVASTLVCNVHVEVIRQ